MKPLVIEFSGIPNSGKSSTIDRVRKFFQNKGYKVIIINEGVKSSSIKPKGGYFYNLAGLMVIFSTLLENYDKYDLILLDRGAKDLWAFSDALLDGKHLSKTEHRSLKSLTKELSKLIYGYFLFICSTETSLSRDEKHSMSKSGIVMNTKFMNKLQSSYKQMGNSAIMIIDSERNSIEKGINIITKHIDAALEKST